MQREQLENETDKVEQIKRLITIDRAPITGSITGEFCETNTKLN